MTMFARMLVVGCAFGLAHAAPGSETESADAVQWPRVFDRIAEDYKLIPDGESKSLELLSRATYKWARSGPHGGNNGAVYVWTNRGCAEAVACFWRAPAGNGKLSVAHELHTLSPAVLTSERVGPNQWKPAAELRRYSIADASPPASSATGRMLQMRAICRNFSARTVSSRGDRTELRLLPQPLYRYNSTNPNIIDGGLFAFVCSVGTDPEVFLLLEAIQGIDGTRWQYALARFSHLDLFVDYEGREVWQSVRDAKDTIAHSADNGYWLFHEPFDDKRLEASGN